MRAPLNRSVGRVRTERMSRSIGAAAGIVLIVTLTGCTTVSKIHERDGREALLIECGAALSFSICHERALKECPAGYTTLSETPGFNRKEIRVRCTKPD
jgi:hypothetical protein